MSENYLYLGHEIRVKRDLTSKREKYYCVLGELERRVVYGGSIDIVVRKSKKLIDKREVDLPLVTKETTSPADYKDFDIPF